jgi:hypothetical protein
MNLDSLSPTDRAMVEASVLEVRQRSLDIISVGMSFGCKHMISDAILNEADIASFAKRCAAEQARRAAHHRPPSALTWR